MVVRVAVRNSGSAGDLIRRLLERVEPEAVSFDAPRHQVCIEARKDPDRTLVQALDVVEEWLSACGRGPTRIEIDGRSYSLAPATAVAGGS